MSHARRNAFFLRRGDVLALVIGLTLASSPALTQPKPVIQINTTTQGIQDEPAVAAQSTGEMFFIWERAARRYGADGVPRDAEDFDTGVGAQPDVAMNDQGDAVVVGVAIGGIVARLYTLDDSVPPSDLIDVHPDEVSESHPSIAMDPAGSFIVAYATAFTEPAENVIWVRRFGPTGIPLGDPQRVSSPSMPRAYLPKVAIHPNGDFAVSWLSEDIVEGVPLLIPMMRFYSSSGAPATDPFSLIKVWAGPPSIAYSPTGWLLATFSDATGVSGVLFDPSGQMTGGPFVLAERMRDFTLWGIEVTALASGEFQIAWFQQLNSNPGDPDVYTRRVAADGTPQGEPTRVHLATEGQQKWPDIAAVGNDVIIVFNYPDGDRSGISAACFLPDGCINVFMDGFESGDTASWSDALP